MLGWRQQPTEDQNAVVRGVFRFREDTIHPVQRPEAEAVTAARECGTCQTAGPTSRDFGGGTARAVAHLRARPNHLIYRERLVRLSRCEPGEWR